MVPFGALDPLMRWLRRAALESVGTLLLRRLPERAMIVWDDSEMVSCPECEMAYWTHMGHECPPAAAPEVVQMAMDMAGSLHARGSALIVHPRRKGALVLGWKAMQREGQ